MGSGHLVTLADPEEYGEQYKTWRLDTLPMLPDRWKLVVIRQTSKQYHAVKEQIFRKDISDIIIATDADAKANSSPVGFWRKPK